MPAEEVIGSDGGADVMVGTGVSSASPPASAYCFRSSVTCGAGTEECTHGCERSAGGGRAAVTSAAVGSGGKARDVGLGKTPQSPMMSSPTTSSPSRLLLHGLQNLSAALPPSRYTKMPNKSHSYLQPCFDRARGRRWTHLGLQHSGFAASDLPPAAPLGSTSKLSGAQEWLQSYALTPFKKPR